MPADLQVNAQVRTDAGVLHFQLEVPHGPIALVGPNGAGKTTLLRLLAGALPHATGEVHVRGETLQAPGVFRPPEQRRAGYLPQSCGLFPHLSARDNVAYGLSGLGRAAATERADALLDELQLRHLSQRFPRRLSGGEQQRVALARAVATSPALLLLDEPTAALDVTARAATRAWLAPHLTRDGCTAVVVTHDVRDLVAWGPTVVLIDDGAVQAQGPLSALRSHEHPFLRELLSPL